VRTHRRRDSSSGGHLRSRRDTRGHAFDTVRDREAPGSNPGPPTIFVFKIGLRVGPSLVPMGCRITAGSQFPPSVHLPCTSEFRSGFWLTCTSEVMGSGDDVDRLQ